MKSRLHAVLLAASLLAGGLVHAQQVFTTNRSLEFGRFVAGAGGTITVSPSGARTRTGGVALVSSTATAASFTFSDNGASNANAAVLIGLPPDGTVTLASATGPAMAVDNFTSSPESAAGAMAGGTFTFTVGATLTVRANQPPGNYTGSIPITIQYQ